MNWEERKDPTKYEFGDGAQLLGVLVNVERVSVRDTATGIGKPATRYTVKDAETGEPVFFFGTYQLDSKLRVSDVGHYVNITCEGADQAAGRNGNAMKLFKVLISKETAPGWAHNGTPITDNDLPPEIGF